MNIDPEYHYEALNVETQHNNSHSLLWWMKRMIAQRKQHPAFRPRQNGNSIPANRKILAFVREFEDEKILVVANLSRFTQCAELDLSKHRDAVPVEVFGRNRFPAITEQPYLLSLGQHAFQWFHLQPHELSQESFSVTARIEDIPVLRWMRRKYSALPHETRLPGCCHKSFALADGLSRSTAPSGRFGSRM